MTQLLIEKGERHAKCEQVVLIVDMLKTDKEKLLALWPANQVTISVANERNLAYKVLNIIKHNINKNRIIAAAIEKKMATEIFSQLKSKTLSNAANLTISLVCKMQGINSIGFDILPMSKISIKAKQSVLDYDLVKIKQLISEIENLLMPENYNNRTPYITITDGAYPQNTEKEIAFFTEWNNSNKYSEIAKNLVTLCILNSLEKVSYTAKDGQFLRWDYRSKKMVESTEYRKKTEKHLWLFAQIKEIYQP